MTSPSPCLVWFRRDLRVSDHPALHAAVQTGAPIIPVFIEDETRPLARGRASQWWQHHALKALCEQLETRGSRLILRRGQTGAILDELITSTGARELVWIRTEEPVLDDLDRAIATRLTERGLQVRAFRSRILHAPDQVLNKQGKDFRVFSAFWRSVEPGLPDQPPLPAPERLPAPDAWPHSEALDTWDLLPRRPDWAQGLRETWTPGESGAQDRLSAFLDQRLAGYGVDRDRPDLDMTSKLSPHLAWGDISPRQVLQATRHHPAVLDQAADTRKFLSELGWREFSHYLLFHNRDLATRNFNPAFDAFPWAKDADTLRRWQTGQTGYPVVDAGLRELWTTGYMHNRVRMICASFLVKHLLIDWRDGLAWFDDTLADADCANNPASWQWVAGSGADAAPYFRIFNPVTQGEKFDPDGLYVRRWVPELSRLPARFIHQPWQAPALVLTEAGIQLDQTYPSPMIELKTGRDRALVAYETVKAARQPSAR